MRKLAIVYETFKVSYCAGGLAKHLLSATPTPKSNFYINQLLFSFGLSFSHTCEDASSLLYQWGFSLMYTTASEL